MHRSRFMPWFLVASLGACTPTDERAPQATSTTSSGGTTGTTGTTTGGAGGTSVSAGGSGGASGGTGGNAGASSGGGPGDAAADSAASDGAPDTPLVVIHQDARPGNAACANDFTALGSNRLLAGGATPADFAAAYNAELLASNTPGPLLFAFFGVNGTSLLAWTAKVGALRPSDAGASVGFAGLHADVPFTLAQDRTLRVAPIAADFELELVTPASTFTLPLGSIALAGALAVGCGSLTVDKATLLVPVRAGGLAFHGSTVQTLMGPPTETLRGVANSAWPLELSGKAAQVYAPGLAGDGGIEP